MWSVVPSLEVILQGLLPVFTEPSFKTHGQIFLGWVMCLGHRTEFRVFEAFVGQRVARNLRHPFDRCYNFFSRSAWTVRELAYRVAVQLVVAMNPSGELLLIVDATLLHKRGKHVWGLGWFYDPVASTEKRAATASGNKWVVLGLGIPIPGTNKYLCLPIHAMLQPPSTGKKSKQSEADLARRMLEDVCQWFPDRTFTLVGDGGYSAKNLLADLNARVRYVGLMRSDAEIYDPQIPPRKSSTPGPKPKKGPRLPAPREIAKKADRARSAKSRWQWTTIEVDAYGQKRSFQVCSFQAVWPKVLGGRPIQVVVCRSQEAGFGEVCLFTTDLDASPAWVVETYAKRTSIEAMFKGSKQVLDIQRPRHFCKESIEKLAPWVWLMQSFVTLWYLTEGHKLPEAEAARQDLGPWETEWSLAHMLRVLRRLTILQTINRMSHSKADLRQLVDHLENYLFLAA
jgi:hypothetical protein